RAARTHLAALVTAVPPVAASRLGSEESGTKDHRDDEEDSGNNAHPRQHPVEPGIAVNMAFGGDDRVKRVGGWCRFGHGDDPSVLKIGPGLVGPKLLYPCGYENE